MRAHQKVFRTLSVLFALAAFTFMFLRMDSRPPYQWVTLYGNLSFLCIIGAILSLVSHYLWPTPIDPASPQETNPPSPLRPIARLFSVATYLCIVAGILIIAMATYGPCRIGMDIHYLGLRCILMGIITGIAAKLCELQLQRQARTRALHDQDPHA